MMITATMAALRGFSTTMDSGNIQWVPKPPRERKASGSARCHT